MSQPLTQILANCSSTGSGPYYLKLRQAIEAAIDDGTLSNGVALPSERELSELASVSRVTVRKAIDELAASGVVIRRHGSGTFVADTAPLIEQSLSQLTSFTQDMERRGLRVESRWLERFLALPSPKEIMALGLATGDRVARLSRLRIASGEPLAIERARVSAEFIPNPDTVGDSLYAELERIEARPVRAVQRISACNIAEEEAALLSVDSGAAGLSIERISYVSGGRPVEFTRSLYRGDAYDFVAELQIHE